MNPAGRAILKPCHYRESEEMPTNQYPIQLSTGRNAYQFHTHTKTGRTPRLQQAAPEPLLTISKEDAELAGVKDGEQVLVESVRGSIQVPVSVGGIAKGQAFIPFHFGYWDKPDERSRAANELTQGE